MQIVAPERPLFESRAELPEAVEYNYQAGCQTLLISMKNFTHVPHFSSVTGGFSIAVNRLADLLLDPHFERDGVSILGGEPFPQAEGLLPLVQTLRLEKCPHIVCYSGYTLETLDDKAENCSSIGENLEEIVILIDGAYVE